MVLECALLPPPNRTRHDPLPCLPASRTVGPDVGRRRRAGGRAAGGRRRDPDCQPWSAAAVYVAGNTATEGGKTYKANWWTQGDDPATHNGVTGTGMPWTLATACGATPPPAPAPAPVPVPPPAPTPAPRPCPRRPHPRPSRRRPPAPGSVTTQGTLAFHLLLGVTGYNTAQDSLALAGDNYTDLIMSNLLAGVMYGHLLQRYTPGQQFQKDYLYGSVLGQLLQENLATQYYTAAATSSTRARSSRP